MRSKRSSSGWRHRKKLVEAHIRQHGYVCPGLGRPPHPAFKFEVDHVVPLALGGTDSDGLRVICRSCNRRHGGKLGNALQRTRGLVANSRIW